MGFLRRLASWRPDACFWMHDWHYPERVWANGWLYFGNAQCRRCGFVARDWD
jgi:hypothetical protein